MLDSWQILIALSGWLAWLAKEIITKLLDWRLARTGNVGIVEGHPRIMCDTISSDGNVYVMDYHPSMATLPQYSDCKRFRIIFDTQFSNDTETQIVFTKFELEFWGVEGLRLKNLGEQALVPVETQEAWRRTVSLTVPAHSVVSARFEVMIGSTFETVESAIRDYFGEAVVLLRAQSIDSKAHAFHLCTQSFAGSNRVVWPPDREYPIFNIHALNRQGWKAGRRAQPRMPAVVATADIK